MSGTKPMVWVGLFVGSTLGAFIPTLWGDSAIFSFSSLILGALGGLLGIYFGFKFSP